MQHNAPKAALIAVAIAFTSPTQAQPQIEEVLVKARKREERSIEVPVTLSTFDARTLELFSLSSVRDIADLTPNMLTTQRGSGAGAAIYLRGIGSNNNDAAFDSAVAMNFDGVTVNSSRLISNGNLDIAQVDILKGPQSLYYGKGASAGVIAIESANPTREFQAEVGLAREFEEAGWTAEALISGPLSDKLLARLAVQSSLADEVTQNTDPLAANDWRGENHGDARLTLVWQPTADLSANFKYSHSEYESDGNLLFADIQCRDGAAQPTIYGFQQLVLPNSYDCNFRDGRIQVADQNPLEAQSQEGNNGGVPYGDQQLRIAQLRLDWDLDERLSLSSVTAWLDMDEAGFDCFAYDSHGSSCITNTNSETSLSQEFRLLAQVNDRLSVNAGLYLQDRELLHRSVQNTFGLPYFLGVADPLMSGQGPAAALDHYNYSIAPPFPVYDPGTGTGYSHDWTKQNPTDHRTVSAYLSLGWDFAEHWNLTAGGRYSDEKKDNIYSTPYVHSAFVALSAPPFNVPSAPGGFAVASEFTDSNFSPEISLSYTPNARKTYYLAYKTGFKSGGISTSQLPVFADYLRLAAGDTSALIYNSETSAGVELGVKVLTLDDRLRLNATAYHYIYEDLQIQNFDPVALAFVTLNAPEVTNEGIELDALYLTPIHGLRLQGSLAYTDTRYTEDFVNILGVNLRGFRRQQAPEWTGSLGLDYRQNLGRDLEAGVHFLGTYSDDYLSNNSDTGGPNSYTQPAHWRGDLALFVGPDDNRWELRLTAKNITDKIVTSETVGRPNAIPNARGESDLVHFHNRGRQIEFSASYRF